MTSGMTALHRAWLTRQSLDLLEFGRAFPHPVGGAAYLDASGRPDLEGPVHTWITARMCHVYGLGSLAGVPGCAPLAQRALDGLAGVLRDDVDAGWFHAVDASGAVVGGGEKSCYDHAFVVLASSTAALAGLARARALLDDATATFLQHFWDDDAGMCVDTWDRGWHSLDPYRGINANMHAVEAMLALGDAVGDSAWYERARRVVTRMSDAARRNDWRIPEHYDSAWTPLPEYNSDNRADQFKPYGATIGHGLEWARLLVQLAVVSGTDDADELTGAAMSLFDRAVADGWSVDGAPGFVYTTDWEGGPVVRDRFHWVAAEAIGAAWALHDATGEPRYLDLYRQWWDHVAAHLIDAEKGSWHHELDPELRPAASVWPGKPDLYHAFQATLVPRLPRRPGFARSLADGLLA